MENIWKLDDCQQITQYCWQHWPAECQHILRVADEVCQNYFIFDLKWDLERTWEPVIFSEVIDWEWVPAGDIEFVFQFNRHRFFICLAQAYQLTKQERYAKKLTQLWMDWIRRVKKTEITKETSWRSLEAGLRGENWTKAFAYLKGSRYLTAELEDMIEVSLTEHAEHLLAVHSPFRYISNWGVIENHGLFEIGLALSDPRQRERCLSAALRHLEIAVQMQVMRDGVHWEQSPMYHNEVLHCLADVWVLANKHQIKIPEVIPEAVRKMAYANVAWKKPDHHQFMMGDSDDMDIRDYLSVAAWLTKDPVLKFAGYGYLDFESIWELGYQGQQQYQLLDKQEPTFASIGLMDSGNYYLRSGWQETANLLHFHCGTIGAGHGHSDQLHFDLVIHGEDVLMDAGRYTYVDGAERREFKDPNNHNTITVDGRWFTVCQNAWEYHKLSQPVKQNLVLHPDYEFVQGGQLGYYKEGVFINRKVVYIKPDLYLIADECYAGQPHTYQHYFHFNNQGQVSVDENHAQLLYEGQACTTTVHFLGHEITLEAVESRVSRHYNQAEPRCSVVVHQTAFGFSSLLTVIQGRKKGAGSDLKVTKIPVYSALKQTSYPDWMAEAVRLTTSGKQYVVVICHQEVSSPTDLVLADECMGFGNVIIFDTGQSQLVGTVLHY